MRTRPIAALVSLSFFLCLTGCDREGPQGPQGLQGLPGPQGLPGTPAPAMAFGYFYALMPVDNAATVALGAAVDFPQNGAASGISRAGTSTFTLPQIGTYEISWQVCVTEAGQLVLALDSGMGAVELGHTVAGRPTGTSQITNHVLIATTVANSILTLRNPAGGLSALTITPLAGGLQPVSASLVIKQLQ